MAMDLMRKAIEIQSPARGLNSSVRGVFMDPRFATDLENVRINRAELRTRPGLANLPTAVQTLTGIPVGAYYYESSTGTNQLLLMCHGGSPTGRFYRYSTSSNLWIAIQDADTALTGTSSEPFSFVSAENYVCFSNGVDGPYRWDSSTHEYLDGTAIPAGDTGPSATDLYPYRYAMPYAGRLIVGYLDEGGTTRNDRVRWCGAHDITTWDSSTDATAGSNDLVDLAGPITGMHALRNTGYIFKRNGIIAMQETGFVDPSFTFATVVEGIGCLEGRTIVEIDGSLFFLGNDNVYAWDAGSLPRPIGTPIRNQLFEELNRARLRQCFALHHETYNEYWLWVVTGTDTDPASSGSWPTKAYIYNYLENAWGVANTHALCGAVHVTEDDVLTINQHTENINDWVTPIDSSLGGDSTVVPFVARFDSYPTVTSGNGTYIDETLVADQGTTYSTVFESSDTRFDRSPDGLDRASVRLPINATISRIILTMRHWVEASVSLDFSMDGGSTWSSGGSKTLQTPTGDVEKLVYHVRQTGQQIRIRATSTSPIALLRITYEYYERAEYK